MASAAKKTDSKGMPTVSAADIRRVAGPLGDEAVAQIFRIGPSLEELEVAARYASGEGDRLDRMGHPLDGRAAQVFDILSAEEADEDEAARR